MDYRPLGNTGLKVSAVGLGGNVFGPPRQDLPSSIATVHRALDLGVNLIDTAHIYNDGKSEEFLGQALAGRRDKVILASKCHLLNLADGETVAQRIRSHCETSLRRLRTDYLDLLQLHFPQPQASAQEILEAFAPLMREGKVRHIGQCNYAAWRHAQALGESTRLGLPAFATAQHQCSLLVRGATQELLPFCAENGVGFLPYFPLAAGLLSGKYQPGQPAPAGTRGAGAAGGRTAIADAAGCMPTWPLPAPAPTRSGTAPCCSSTSATTSSRPAKTKATPARFRAWLRCLRSGSSCVLIVGRLHCVRARARVRPRPR
jgi:aryl-alcohol dehydrogenase-like predicted oxidoreductase